MSDAPTADKATEVLKKTYIALKRAQDRVDALEARRSEPSAIIGMACRLPGGANDPAAFWDLLRRGGDACGPVPPERWESDRFFNPSQDAPGQTHAARANFLDVPVDGFDAPFFGISAKEAISLDPQQRLLLEVSWESLEDAGIDPTSLRGSRTGVFMGLASDDYAQAHRHSGRLDLIDGYALTGTCFAPAAGRVSYTFGFEGPSMAIDTACSSSLVAVHLACQSLRDGETDLALAGGVNLILSPVFHIASTKLGTISPDGLCKTFDSAADGYGRGEGCGIVVLRRLSDAQARGDRILAVIRGTAVNQDGKSNGLTAPNGLAQERVIREALDRSGLAPGDIGYIEVHGTGTALGDPIEVEAIGRVMLNRRPAEAPVILSTAKVNIGHLEAAAGIAGLIKAVQSLRHAEIPPHLHLANPSSHIPWGQYPFKVVTEVMPWPEGATRHRAGVSSFGFSGTNAHVIVEAAPGGAAAPDDAGKAHVLPLSARTEEALQALARRWCDWLVTPSAPLADACLTAGVGRGHFAHRLAVVGRTATDFGGAVRSYLDGKGGSRHNLATGVVAARGVPRIAALFTGQGSQYVGMGRTLYRTEPVFRGVVDGCDAALSGLLGRSIRDMMHGEEASEDELRQTGFAQPAIFTIELALYRLWESWGITPSIVCGHSIGEYAAAHVAGMLTFDDALALVAERGRLMQQLPTGGAMAAVFASEAVVAEMLRPGDGVSIAAVNTPNETVVSGPEAAIAVLTRRLEAAGLSAQRLQVSHAFHSSLMRPIVPAFEAAALARLYGAARLPIVSTVTGREAVAGDLASARYWAGQIEAPVRFAAAAQTLAAEGVDIFLEIGPTPILVGLSRQSVAAQGRQFLGSLKPGADDRQRMLDSLARVYAHGAEIDWAAVHSGSGGRKTSVPSYPFQRKSYYRAPIADSGAAVPIATMSAHPYLGHRIRSAVLPVSTVLYQALFTADQPRFIKDHQILGKMISPGAGHLSMAFAASGRRGLEDVSFTAPLVVEPGRPRVVQLVIEGDREPAYRLMSQLVDEPSSDWVVHCAGRIGSSASALPPPRTDLEAVRARCQGAMSSPEFYHLMEAVGYTFGPDFRCIRDIRKGADEAICRVEASQRIDEGAIHPGLLDSVLQTVLPAGDAAADKLTGGSVLVPLHIGAISLHGDLSQPLHCHSRVAVTGDLVKGEIIACDGDGAAVLEVRDFLLKVTDQATLYQELRQDDRGLVHSLEWRPLSAAASEVPANSAAWVVFADNDGWGDAIANRLRERGTECLELVRGEQPDRARSARDCYGINPHDAEALSRSLLSWLKPSRRRINVLFAWHGAGADPAADCRDICAELLPLVQALGAREGRECVRLWLLTRQAQTVVPEDRAATPPSLEGPMLWGFGRAIAGEFPEIWGGLVDLDARPSASAVAALLDVIDTPAGEDQLAVRRGHPVFGARLVGARSAAATAAPNRRGQLPRLARDEAYFLDKGPLRTLDDLGFRTRARRAPGPREVEVAVLASGLNFRDVLNALGQYPGEGGLLGFETIGTIVDRGADVTDLAVGETVIVLAAPGCIASHVTIPRVLVARKPAALGVADAAALPAAFLTAHYALNHLGRMRRGDRVLIHAAAGGVGLAAVQLALAAGAEVFATAGAPEKHEHLRAMGVAHVMSSRNTEFAAQIDAATDGRGVDIVLNSLTGDFIPASFSVLARGGRFLEMGKIGIWDEARVRSQDPTWFYRPFDLAAVVLEEPAAVMGMFDDLLAEFSAGRLRPLPVSVFRMADAEEAFRFMAQARHVGKIVLSREDEHRRTAIEARGLIRADASYLVTGGLGALGLRVARWLVDEGARHLVLAGRREPDHAARSVLGKLESQGAAVQVVQGDITVAADLERIMGAAARPPLAGIFHAAGLLDDGMIADLDPARIERVMAPKVSGAWRLHEATRHLDLDFFVLFSSVAAIIGNLGQASYAAANAFLDGLAAYRRRLGLAATSINWGPWAETGMAARLEVDRFIAQGIRSLTPAQGLRTLKHVLAENPVQAVVADIDWPVYGASHGLDGRTGLFAALVTDTGRPKADAAQPDAARNIKAELQAALPVEREGVLRLYLQDLVRQTLGYGYGEPIAVDQPLNEQGFDSLMSVDMRNRLNRSLGRVLPASLLFDYPTLDRIARYLLESVLLFDDPASGPPAAATPEQLLAEIEMLVR
jgi:acyl transferase domain-containing protein/NAD(P)-dependent dehydrogenase (short-subunit alcohol dehydrogenase family)